MKYKVQLLNYDSEWVDYCIAESTFQCDCALNDLKTCHNFKDFQIRCVNL